MADLSVTAAGVQATSNTVTKLVQFGATITAGQSLYLDTSDSKWKLADANNSTTTAGADGVAVALTNGADGVYGIIARSGSYAAGATVSEGLVYVVSATAGGIAPAGDLTSGWNATIVGVGAASNQIELRLHASGQTVA